MCGLRTGCEGIRPAHAIASGEDGLLKILLFGKAARKRCTKISLSLLVWKMAPSLSSSPRSSEALVRLPLWASAISMPQTRTTSGWAFLRTEPPRWSNARGRWPCCPAIPDQASLRRIRPARAPCPRAAGCACRHNLRCPCFPAAMLEGVQTEIGHPSRFRMSRNTKNSAHTIPFVTKRAEKAP